MTDAASIIQRKLDELQVQGYTAIPQAPGPRLGGGGTAQHRKPAYPW